MKIFFFIITTHAVGMKFAKVNLRVKE